MDTPVTFDATFAAPVHNTIKAPFTGKDAATAKKSDLASIYDQFLRAEEGEDAKPFMSAELVRILVIISSTARSCAPLSSFPGSEMIFDATRGTEEPVPEQPPIGFFRHRAVAGFSEGTSWRKCRKGCRSGRYL